MEALLAGRHVLGRHADGGGQVALLPGPRRWVKGGLTIVVSPLVALMAGPGCGTPPRRRLRPIRINSSIERDANVAAWRRVASGQTRLLYYLAPERLMTERMLDAVGQARCQPDRHRRGAPAFRNGVRRSGANMKICRSAARHLPDGGRSCGDGRRRTRRRGQTSRPAVWRACGNAGAWLRPAQHQACHRTQAGQQSGQLPSISSIATKGRSGIVYCLSRKKTEEMAGLPRKERRHRASPITPA